jgi:hypothetical protein
MKESLRSLLVVAVMLLSSVAFASPMDEESKEIFARLLKQHAASVVRINFVMKSSFQGQDQSQESSTTGVIVDPRGLILVPRMVAEPSFPGVDKLTSEQRASFKLETRDFRVRLAGQDTPLEAEALTSDADLGVAWLRLKPPATAAGAAESAPPPSYPAIRLSDSADAAPGQAYYVIERLDDRYGGAALVSWGVLVGEVTVPRPAHITTGALGLGFSAEGKVLGYVVADLESMDSATMMTGQGGMILTMAPAARLASASSRAASLLDETD